MIVELIIIFNLSENNKGFETLDDQKYFFSFWYVIKYTIYKYMRVLRQILIII
jgi:hypothetical protein